MEDDPTDQKVEVKNRKSDNGVSRTKSGFVFFDSP